MGVVLGRAALAAVVLACAGSSGALETVVFEVGEVGGDGWRAHDVRSRLTLGDNGQADVVLTIGRLSIAGVAGALTGVALHCPRAVADETEVRCRHGTLQWRSPAHGTERVSLAFGYRLDTRAAHLEIRDTQWAGGHIKLTVRPTSVGWQFGWDAQGVALARLSGVLPLLEQWPPGTTMKGTLGTRGRLDIVAGRMQRVELDASVTDLGFASGDGVNAGEMIGASLHTTVTPHGRGLRIEAALEAGHGTLCIDTCWGLPATPLAVKAHADWQPGSERLVVERLEFNQPGLVHGAASATLALGAAPRVDHLSVRLARSSLAALYRPWLQPLLIGTGLEELDTGGTVAANVDYDAGELRARVDLDTVDVADRKGRFALAGASGVLTWSSRGEPLRSELAWREGQVYRVALGAGRVAVESSGDRVRLLEQTTVPVFDGALRIDQLALARPGMPDMRWEFQGELEPVSMEALSRALGWPVMAGTLSGRIPAVSYDAGALVLGGELSARAFDGEITVRELRLERLFGVLPALGADIAFHGLDLDALTRTFSFGSIQGRLSGRVRGLRMQDWHPVAFDAFLGTPGGDRSRHRISQRAVDNLTALGGGGMTGALSRGVMRLFDEFSYDRIGIRCRLHDGVCEMGGIAPTDGGYYIVKGGGLPRIDIIGYADRVDWNELVQRLKSITAIEAPVRR